MRQKSGIPKESGGKWFKLIILLGVVAFAAFGCSSGSDSTPAVQQGKFLDSAVSGVEYETPTQSGITDADGTFKYAEGETVNFSIGDIELGETAADETVTPVDLVPGATDETDPTVTNITRFLMTLDADNNPDNGIEITEPVRRAAKGMRIEFKVSITDFENSQSVQEVVGALTSLLETLGERLLVLASIAQEHLRSTLDSLGGDELVDDTVTEEPQVTEEPAVTEPPVVTEPVVTEPPVTEEPVVTEPPVTEEPVVTEPPVTEEPVVTEPPVTEEPVVTEPPVTEEPVVTEPPVTEEPVVTEPPVTEEPQVIEQPDVTDVNDVDNDGDGLTENQGDCDDADVAVNPVAIEVCGNDKDDDCTGGDLSCDDVDNDEDGFTETQGDCDDNNIAANPGADEICGDGIDQDCETTDLICVNTENANEVLLSNGFKVSFLEVIYNDDKTSTWRFAVEEMPEAQDLSNWVLELPDCVQVVDASPAFELVSPDPNANLNGIKWETAEDFEAGEFIVTLNGLWATATVSVGAKGPDVVLGQLAGPSCEEVVFEDGDGDGITAEDGDCDDTNPDIYPGAAEVCGDGVDQDCDGTDAICPEDIDDDADGVTENDGDCNDEDAAVNPSATEICGNDIDDDCADGDLSCDDVDNDEDGVTENEGDCDDADKDVNPGATEICGNDKDDDCVDGDLSCDEVLSKSAATLLMTTAQTANCPVMMWTMTLTVSQKIRTTAMMKMQSSTRLLSKFAATALMRTAKTAIFPVMTLTMMKTALRKIRATAMMKMQPSIRRLSKSAETTLMKTAKTARFPVTMLTMTKTDSRKIRATAMMPMSSLTRRLSKSAAMTLMTTAPTAISPATTLTMTKTALRKIRATAMMLTKLSIRAQPKSAAMPKMTTAKTAIFPVTTWTATKTVSQSVRATAMTQTKLSIRAQPMFAAMRLIRIAAEKTLFVPKMTKKKAILLTVLSSVWNTSQKPISA